MEDVEPVCSAYRPLKFKVVQIRDGVWKVAYTKVKRPVRHRDLSGTFTTEDFAKRAIVSHLIKKEVEYWSKPHVYKKKKTGRPVKFRRKSVSWKSDYTYGSGKDNNTVQ